MKLLRALVLTFFAVWVFSITPRVISRLALADPSDRGKASAPAMAFTGFAGGGNGRGFGGAIQGLVMRARVSATAGRSAAADGSYRLVRIEVTRKYGPGDWLPASSYQPGTQTYGADQRSFPLGWDFRWGDNKTNTNHAMSEVTLTQVPTTVAPWVSATVAAHMRGEWNTTGYGNGRNHLIRLTGAAGDGHWEYGGDPSGTYQGAFDISNSMAAPQPDGNRLVLTITAALRFGDDHAGDMDIRLVYEPGGRGAEIQPSVNATPQVVAVEPPQAARGSEVALKITGRNFVTGATLSFWSPAIRVLDVLVLSSAELAARVQIPQDAPPGTTTLYVRNPSGRTGEAAFRVIGETTPPAGGTRPPAYTSGLVAWWKFDEGTGNTAFDSSGSGNHAALMKRAKWAPGKLGGALSLDGEDDYAATNLDVQPSAMPSTTWTAWVYPTRVKHDKRQFILSDNDRGHARSILITADDGRLAVFTGSGSGIWAATSADSKQWQHVAIVYTPSSIDFFKNGIQYHSPHVPKGQETRLKLEIGRNPGFGEHFQGFIDEVRIYNRALSAEEIQAIYYSDASSTRLTARLEAFRSRGIGAESEDRIVSRSPWDSIQAVTLRTPWREGEGPGRARPGSGSRR